MLAERVDEPLTTTNAGAACPRGVIESRNLGLGRQDGRVACIGTVDQNVECKRKDVCQQHGSGIAWNGRRFNRGTEPYPVGKPGRFDTDRTLAREAPKIIAA